MKAFAALAFLAAAALALFLSHPAAAGICPLGMRC